LIGRFHAQSEALREQAVAEAQLPDPQLRFGIEGLPVDSFSRSEEDMTQLQVGVAQAFPRGRTRALKAEQARALATAEQARAADQARNVLRSVRLSFLESYYQAHAQEVIRQSRGLFEQVVNITRAAYATGREVQQDVWRAQLELAQLDDRLTRAQTEEGVARAELSRWIGSRDARRPLAQTLPKLSPVPAREAIEARLLEHPLMEAEAAQVESSRKDVDIARQAYKPAWMLELSYGQRVGANPEGDSRSDLLSAMVSVDLPLFRAKRQDRRLAASQKQAQAAEYARAERLRELRTMFNTEYSNWERLGERLKLYRERLIPQSDQNARAALRAYQSGVTEFTPVISAYLGELENRLEALRVEVDRAKAHANLSYLAGEPL
jgi:outer membrane protein TolC